MDRTLRLLACQIEIPRVVSKEQKTAHLNALAKKIADYFKISSTLIQIKSGHKSDEKIIEILE